ncbi:hypothetical protein HYI43_06410 [Staphylococcus taiwanensis]|nr:hypothetical protein HYI43_06410 [Staphylococcus taiwanensis]
MALSLTIAIMIFTLMPNIYKIANYYLKESYDINQTEFAFFQVDINNITKSKKVSFQLINQSTILIHSNGKDNYLKFKNHKIIYESNRRGNITFLNNVLEAHFHRLNSEIILLNLKIGEKNNYYEKTIYL